ncbi:hypothetical protein [Alteribacter natronophilus]|uniref:hypothetical protein n=1 Tax=Alteribacter natronophilus TaxID=2583810 RepID=UPI00110DA0DD|nr:hypothetical protein [Alteribacter natronophilus]TMW71214.1 hypothetical protein FGB90_14765 [Alteribacter natronophilus]
MPELVRNNEEIFIILYCFILLWVNISFIKEYKSIKEGLGDISSENELEINPNTMAMMVFSLMFNFIRRWLIYLLAVLITGNIFVAVVSLALFVTGLYDSLFNYSLARVKKSKVKLYLAVMDTVYISVFVIYLLAV